MRRSRTVKPGDHLGPTANATADATSNATSTTTPHTRPGPVGDAAGTGVPIDLSRQAWEFVGYDASLVEESLGDIEVYGGSPGVSVLHDVWYLPGELGLFARDGTRIDHTCLRRLAAGQIFSSRPSIRPPAHPRSVSHPLIYVGHPFIHHYGHFLTESISRLWYATEDTSTPLLCHDTRALPAPRRTVPRPPRPRAWRGPHLDRFHERTGIDERRFVSFRSPVLLEEVIVPRPTLVLGGPAFVRHAQLPETVARRSFPPDPSRTGQPLFLSRGRLPRRRRRAADDTELVDRLRAAGFAVAHPERLDLRRQIELVNRHEVVVGLKGSAMHNVLFFTSARSTAVYLLSDRTIPANFLRVDATKPTRGVFIGALGREAPRANGERTAAVVDVDRVMAGLADLGLIGGSTP